MTYIQQTSITLLIYALIHMVQSIPDPWRATGFEQIGQIQIQWQAGLTLTTTALLQWGWDYVDSIGEGRAGLTVTASSVANYVMIEAQNSFLYTELYNGLYLVCQNAPNQFLGSVCPAIAKRDFKERRMISFKSPRMNYTLGIEVEPKRNNQTESRLKKRWTCGSSTGCQWYAMLYDVGAGNCREYTPWMTYGNQCDLMKVYTCMYQASDVNWDDDTTMDSLCGINPNGLGLVRVSRRWSTSPAYCSIRCSELGANCDRM